MSLTVSDWAAITQAVGAIVALAVAVGVPIWQRSKEDQRRATDERRRIEIEEREKRERSINVYGVATLLTDQLLGALVECVDGEDTERKRLGGPKARHPRYSRIH